jgi:hypothetical protein
MRYAPGWHSNRFLPFLSFLFFLGITSLTNAEKVKRKEEKDQPKGSGPNHKIIKE